MQAFLLNKRDVKHVILWMDNCSSQNKNWSLFSFLVYMINSGLISAESITLKFFEPGHTYMSADSFHHQLELALKRKQKVYDFEDFVESVKETNCRKNVVKVMEVKDFYNFEDFSSQHKLRKQEPRIYMKDIIVVKATKGQYNLEFKNFHDDEVFQKLDFLRPKYLKLQDLPAPTQKKYPRGVKESTKTSIINKLRTNARYQETVLARFANL